MDPMRGAIGVLVLAAAVAAAPASASETLDWSGFALLRGAAYDDDGSGAEGPVEEDAFAAQLQIGVDWQPAPQFGAHIHLLARNDDDDAHRGRAGIVQAYLDQTFERGAHRVKLFEGAFFLPTSRENVDALWESPYTITPSALNSWVGEEFRPIGVDAAYTLRRTWTGGVTIFTGNDTLGALPAVRGWALRDYWSVLGEHLPVGDDFTSISAENDDRLGWSARGRWNSDRSMVQLTHIDNNSDARDHGTLLNWATTFTVAAADTTIGEWTIAAEHGWGITKVFSGGELFPTDLRASYVLVSRRFGNGRASLRAERFGVDSNSQDALTAAFFWSPRGRLRAGVEAIVSGAQRRVAAELRYSFNR
jgi:hypothetical protein